MILAERIPPPTMTMSGIRPSSIGETGPPVLGNGDAEAEAVALAVELAVAVALMLADALLLADALDIALGLIIAEAEALELIIAEFAIICPLGIMCIPLMFCAIAAAEKANTATVHRATNNSSFLKVPPLLISPC